MSAQTKVVLQKKAKGSRPYFFEDASVDKLLSMLMGLTGEVSVMADRIDTLERLLQEKGVLTDSQLNSYRPNPEVRNARDERRDILLANVLRIIRQDGDDPDAGQRNDQAYKAAIDMVEQG